MIARQAALRTIAGILKNAGVPPRQQAAALRKHAGVCVQNANGLGSVATSFAGAELESMIAALRDEAEAYNASAVELERKADADDAAAVAESDAKDRDPER